MKLPNDYAKQVAKRGFAIVENVIAIAQVDVLRNAIQSLPQGDEVRARGNVYGVRNLLSISEAVQHLAAAPSVRSLVTPVLGEDCFAVRATFFDKVLGANWNLRWHQDSAIAVQQQIDTVGYGAWSNKAGTIQVRPPEQILQRMLAVRLHLDECPQNNGALRVLAGSHNGYMQESLDCYKAIYEEVCCEVGLGGAMIMLPLLVHASSAAASPGHRRVIHIEFANVELPGELEWKHRIAT